MDFSGVSVLCIGDVMLDRFVQGEVERISPEAPVPVIRLQSTRSMLGGAGNVAHNIARLGGRAILIGLLGEDAAAHDFEDLLAASAGVVSRLVASPLRPTTCKTRFLAGGQQVVRTDEESLLPLQPAEEAALLAAIDAAIGAAAAVVLSDYGKGALGPRVIAHAIAAARTAGRPVFVDPKSADFSLYRGADCITPNLRELAAATRLPVGSEAEVEAAARMAMALAGAQAILATRSAQGMMLIERDGPVHSVPARAREVFDVSGAGDTVIAVMALAHASGLPLAQAMRIANAAAGVVVSKIGTATVDPGELLHELDADSAADAPVLHAPARIAALVDRWKRQGLVVGFTNGCFDILHAGHVALLREARGHCDRLVVALNEDASVSRLKGAGRPVNPLAQRAAVIAALRPVDAVVAFAEDTPLALIRQLLPDVLIKGADYRVDQVVGGDVVQAAGGRVVLCGLVAGQSTTGIVARIRAVDIAH
jgi:D-beta-D-heptose 7-phosphate kinase/D-beta-D-heptose 1-phosphate adenosyltransferase